MAVRNRATSRTLLVEIVAPLAIFYGLRALGVEQFPALLLGAVLPTGNAVHSIVTQRRVSGVTLFVLCSMVLTVAMSLVTGSPRVLLIRDAWATAAFGIWMLTSLLTRHPFLYEGTRVLLDEGRQRVWTGNWERYPQLRHALRVSTAVWGGAFLADTAVRVWMAATLPVDLVPLLENVLLVVTIAVVLVFQRVYGRAHLRRHGLQMRGVHLSPITEKAA